VFVFSNHASEPEDETLRVLIVEKWLSEAGFEIAGPGTLN